MPIFGQVWLWSSLAFLLGALLCWVLVALPARRRVAELESEYDRGYRRADRSGARHREDEYDDYDDDYDRRRTPLDDAPEPLIRAYAQPHARQGLLPERPRPAGLMAPPETDTTDTTDTELADGPRASATQYLNVASGSLGGGMLEAPPEVPARPGGRGWFDDEQPDGSEPLEAMPQLRAPAPERDVRLVDDGADEGADRPSGGTVFTQRTHPIPGELIRQIDEAGQAGKQADEPADALVDDLADNPADGLADRLADTETGAHTRTRHQRLAEPAPSTGAATPSEFDQGTEIFAKPEAEPLGTAPSLGAHGQTEVMPAAIEPPTEVAPASEPAINPLPKRVPGKPRGHTPFGVTLSKPEPAAADTATATATESDPARSLFEPIVPADDAPAMPPPHRVRGDGNGRGPFGPGSAMPLPGGASPSPEFTIKASVSAQRYCTPESPQFGSTVAEVWFKSSADAERVGFRPVG